MTATPDQAGMTERVPDPDPTTPSGGAPRQRRRPSRLAISLVTAPLIGLTLLGYAGEALFPALVKEHDAALIVLAPSLRNFGLVTNQLDAWVYYGLGLPRVLLTDPLYYLLGLWYGTAAITWMERRTRTWGSMLRQVEQGFEKYGYFILFALPYAQTTLLAGAARLPLHRVLIVRGAGLALRLYLVRRAGQAFEGPLDRLTDWISDYRVPLLVVTFSLVLLSIALEVRRKGETQVESLAHLDEEIEEIEEAQPDRHNR